MCSATAAGSNARTPDSCCASSPERGPLAPPAREDTALDDLFPREAALDGCRVFALDSNRYPSEYLLSNAVGQFGDDQLARLRARLDGGSGPVVVLCHHHVARPIEYSAVNDPMMIALDGKELLEMLAAYNHRAPARNRVLLLHGHKHFDLLCRYQSPGGGQVKVYGHCSSTMGHEGAGDKLDGVARFAAVWLGADGDWYVEPHRVQREAERDGER